VAKLQRNTHTLGSEEAPEELEIESKLEIELKRKLDLAGCVTAPLPHVTP